MRVVTRWQFVFFLGWMGISGTSWAQTIQSYVIEDRNDPLFGTIPPPPPVSRETYEYDVTGTSHVEEIDIDSTRLRTLSIRIENLGSGLIRKPYLFGPHGWDFRSLEAIAASVTSEAGLTNDEKFIRVHEWMGLHFASVLGNSESPYVELDFASNPLRNLNQYGHGMCGPAAYLANALGRAIPPIGSRKGRNVKLGAHRVGEGFWDGVWHTFDATPGIGVLPWIYYDADNRTMAPSWKYLIDHPELVTRIQPYTNATIDRYLVGATGETYGDNPSFRAWDFNYDLRPGESITMYPDMRGRLDRTSARQDNSERYRDYSDYGSAVFRYEPDFTSDTYAPYVRQTNVLQTPDGLVPADPTQPSEVILEMKSTWCFAGADVKTSFKTGGLVYVGVRSNPYDTQYSSTGISWRLLSSGVKEYGSNSIEGKMAYWLKFVFEGPDSGLDGVTVDSEVQMSPWSMPRLEYGVNRIRFEALDMGSSAARITYAYDPLSPFHNYEKPSGTFGRHVPVRVGGVLHRGAKVSSFDYGKGRFWDRLVGSPNTTISTKVEIFRITGEPAGVKIRTLVSKSLKPGWYNFYWNGRDDAGVRVAPGMYAYKLSFGGKLFHGERLYLFSKLWPVPNEPSRGSPAAPLGEPMASSDAEGAESPPGLEPELEEMTDASPHAASLVVEKLAATLRFDEDRRVSPGFADSAYIRVVLPGVARGWDPAGKAFRMNIGGFETGFLLDRYGRGVSSSGRVALHPRGDDVVARIAVRGSWAGEWADEGVSPGESDEGSPLGLMLHIELEGMEFAARLTPHLVAEAGKVARLSIE